MSEAKKIKNSVDCRHCQTQMRIIKVKKHPGKWPFVLVVAGAFCCLFIVGALVGIPILLLGIYMSVAEETVSNCPNCGNYFKVLLIKPDAE